MMNYQDDIPLSDSVWCFPDIAGEAAAAADHHHHPPISMSSDYSKEDLFELVWQHQGGGGSDDKMMEQAVVSCHRMFPRLTPVHEPKVLPDAPADDEMAAWLSVIAKVQENSHDDDGSGWRTPLEKGYVTPSFIVKERVSTKDTAAGNFSEKAAARGAKRSHHGEQHNLTEKRRRCKINERLETLQQLVPGCDKSNHTSTLEHTIQYMKWLQHLVQAMSIGQPFVRPPAASTTAVYPPPPASVAPVVLGPLPMFPFRPLMPCVAQYPAPAVLLPVAAATHPLHPDPAAARDPGSAPATAGDAGANHGHKSRTKLNGSRTSISKSLRHMA